MSNQRRLRAIALGAVLVLSTGLPAVAATGDLPDLGADVSVSRLASGGTAIVRPTQGAPVAAIELWYRAPSVGFGVKPVSSVARLAAQTVAASKPLVGDPLGKQISDAGGRLGITVYADAVDVSAVVPASSARAIVKAMTTAYFAPVATEDGFRFAQRDIGQEALFSTFDLETVVRDAVFAQLFADGTLHYATLGSSKDVADVTYADVTSFATRAFRAQNATLVVSGAVDPSIATAAVAGRPETVPGTGGEASLVARASTAPSPVAKTFVQPSGGYGWVGPAIASQREATAMDFIADYLFRSDVGSVTRHVSDVYPDAVIVGQFITLHDPGVMFVAFSGKDPAAVRTLVDAGFASVRKPLAAATFRAAIASFEYHLLSDLQTPLQLADNFGWYSVEGAPAYAPGANGEKGAYFDAARSLTPDFVASVAEKYLGKTPAVVTLAPEAKKATP